MHSRNRSKRSQDVEHIVETRSKAKTTPQDPIQNGKRRVRSNGYCAVEPTSVVLMNGHHETPSSSFSNISPRKLRELEELKKTSHWRDPEDGKHHRTTKRSLMSQRTSPKTSILQYYESSSSDVSPRVATRSMKTISELKIENDLPDARRIRKAPDISRNETPRIPNGILKHPGREGSQISPKTTEPPTKKPRTGLKLRIRLPPPPKKKIVIKKKKIVIKKKRRKLIKRMILRGPIRRVPRGDLKSFRRYLKKICRNKKKTGKEQFVIKKHVHKKKLKEIPSKIYWDILGIKLKFGDQAPVSKKMDKLRFLYRQKMTSKLPIMFPRDRMPIKRTLRLKRLADARSLLAIPRKRLKNHLKFRFARKPIRALPLKNGIKWLSLLTPCQRSCNCLGFQTDTVAWKLKMVHSKSIYDLKAEDLCKRCKHPLWEHRKKWQPQDRRDRYAVVRDIRLLQNLILKEKNEEKFRIYFILWKDLISTIVENTPVPKKLYCSSRVLENDSSIRNALQLYMQSKEAKKLGFVNKHALDLLKTLDSFDYPSPNKTSLFSMFFLSSKFKNSKAERQFQQWYRQWYELYIAHCILPQFLLSLPQFCVVDIVTYHFLTFIDQYVSLKLEEQYATTGDPEIKIISVLFKKLVDYCKTLKLICPKQARRLPLRGDGENVLSKTFISELEVHNMGMRHAPSLNAILNEESGPDYFKKLPPPEPNMILQVDDPIRFCRIVWKAQRRKQLGQFLEITRPKTEKIHFLRDPNTLTDFNDVSQAMEKKKRRRYFGSNCDRERDEGKIEMVLLRNHRNGNDVHRNDFLIQFVTVIHRQLPKMPKHYILKLVMDRHHRSLILLKYIKRGSSPGWTVLGGICFRPFVKEGFSEIVFVAVHADHQVRGYGGYLMDHLKRMHVEQLGFPHLLTFADKNAIGYFKKQGFSKESEVPKTIYGRFIKEYDSATLMYCHARICNNKDDIFYWAKKMANIFQNIHKINCPEWYSIKKSLKDKFIQLDLIPMSVDRKEKIDQIGLGLNETDIGLPKLFWQDQYEKMWKFSHFENVQTDDEEFGYLSENEEKITIIEDKKWFKINDCNGKEWNTNLENEIIKMFMMLEALYRCPFSWPFHFPVDEYDAPTYHDEISRPMTLEIIEDRIHWGYYVSISQFIIDLNLIISNCYSFNTQYDGYYYHSGFRLHQYFNAMALQIFGLSIKRYLLPIPKQKPTIRKIIPKIMTFTFEPPKPYWYPQTKQMPIHHFFTPIVPKKKTTRRRRRNSAVVRVSKKRNRPKKLVLRRIKPDKKKKSKPKAISSKKNDTPKMTTIKINGISAHNTPTRKSSTILINSKNTIAMISKSTNSTISKEVSQTPSPKRNSMKMKSPIKAKIENEPEIVEESRRETRASTRHATYVSQKTAPPLRRRSRR